MTASTPDTPLADADARHLRRAIVLSVEAAERGNRPFGSVVVSATGEILGEARNTTGEGDCTGHAETNALRLASTAHPRAAFDGSTVYASGEPCVMCAGAIFWSGARRVVYGIDAVALRAFRELKPGAADLEMSCRDVFRSSAEPFEVIGPALSGEAAAPHVAYWGEPPAGA